MFGSMLDLVPPAGFEPALTAPEAWHHLAPTSGNVPTGDPSGHVLGTGRITAGHALGAAGSGGWAGASEVGGRRVAAARLRWHCASCRTG